MELSLAFGGAESRWLYLDGLVRDDWSRVLALDEPVLLQELYATSSTDELSHPGEVPMPAELTVRQLLDMVAEELGPRARIVDVRLLVQRDPRLTFLAHEERSVRFEADDDDRALVGVLDKLAPLEAGSWTRLLARLREEAMTGRPLRLRFGGDSVLVRSYVNRSAFERDDPVESLLIPLAEFDS